MPPTYLVGANEPHEWASKRKQHTEKESKFSWPSQVFSIIYKMKIKAKLLSPLAHRVAWFSRKETWDSFTCCVCVVSSVECDTFLSDDLNHSQWDAVADRTLIMTTLIFSARRDIFRRRNLFFIFHFTFRCIFNFYNLAAVVYFAYFTKVISSIFRCRPGISLPSSER